jgi:hypothetical protein
LSATCAGQCISMPSPDLATGDQRWTVYELFTHFAVKDIDQICADAARILGLDGLTDLRELTRDGADKLIAELRRAAARERVSDE